ncbi:hypothetical protein V1264_014569 [Littorina saxatilis]|uniref:HMG box domain-containing protein n=1 Tax=Littorina saxatilis TaxID=31220 RepID=A0AAN9BSU8_9CAEN
MAHNSKDITFLEEAGCQSVKKLSVTLKSILTGPKTGKWSYAFTKKNVNFVQQEGRVKNVRRTKMQDKWRKYVAQQFKTLHKKKRQQRTRWLGRAGRNRKKSGPESTPACGDSSENVPSTSEDPSTSSELQESFELPEPDHRKRKKKTKEKAKQRSSPKTTKPKRNQPQKQQEEQEKEANAEGGEEVAPKRPPNAYIIFSQVCRVEFKDLMIPTFDSRLVAMVLGHVWRFLSKAERHCFYEEAEKLSREYQDEKQRLKPVAGDTHPYEKLKRPLNAFMLFCQDRRMELQPKTSALSGQRAAKQMARMWNRMSAKDKQVYVDRAALASSLYHERLKECREQVSILPITLGTTEEEDTIKKKGEEKDNKGDKNATKTTASNPALKKFGKNNNKWLTDSDTDGSQTNSDTHLRVQDLAPNSTRHRSTLPPCSPLVNAPQHSSSLEMIRNRLGKESEPGLVGPRVSFTDSGEQLQGRPLSGSDIGLSPSDASNSSDVSLASNGYTRRRGGSRGRKKKKQKRRVRRVGDASRGGQGSRQVRWKDEFYPWDTYSPVASVLCDEDICTRLCRPPTPPLSQTSLYRPAPGSPKPACVAPLPRSPSQACVAPPPGSPKPACVAPPPGSPKPACVAPPSGSPKPACVAPPSGSPKPACVAPPSGSPKLACVAPPSGSPKPACVAARQVAAGCCRACRHVGVRSAGFQATRAALPARCHVPARHPAFHDVKVSRVSRL